MLQLKHLLNCMSWSLMVGSSANSDVIRSFTGTPNHEHYAFEILVLHAASSSFY